MIYSAIGPDLDLSDIMSLHRGQKILVELDGQDSNPGCSVDGDIPWNVVESSSKRCVLEHPFADAPLILDYERVINRDPAVLKTAPSQDLISKSEYDLDYYPAILKFSAYRIDRKEARQRKKRIEVIKTKARKCQQSYEWLLVRSIVGVKSLRCSGWSHNSINRMALRTRVSYGLLCLVYGSDFQDICNMDITREELLEIYEALYMIRLWIEEFHNHGIDEKKTANIPAWPDRS